MKKRRLLVMVFALSAFALAGCSAPNSSTTSTSAKPNEFLDQKSDLITEQGKFDFESLIFYNDDFTKEAYYNLNEEEQGEIKLNDIYLNFFLYKGSDSTHFVPKVSLNYLGKDWLFMKSVLFKVNDDVMSFSILTDPNRERLGNYVSEYVAFNVTEKNVNFLGNSKSNSDLDIRVMTNTYKEIKLTSVEYQGMKKILSAYRYLLSSK